MGLQTVALIPDRPARKACVWADLVAGGEHVGFTDWSSSGRRRRATRTSSAELSTETGLPLLLIQAAVTLPDRPTGHLPCSNAGLQLTQTQFNDFTNRSLITVAPPPRLLADWVGSIRVLALTRPADHPLRGMGRLNQSSDRRSKRLGVPGILSRHR
jgi:hypothetical protein